MAPIMLESPAGGNSELQQILPESPEAPLEYCDAGKSGCGHNQPKRVIIAYRLATARSAPPQM